MGLIESTATVINRDLLSKIQNYNICIIGCGGVGSNIADMLVRTGATKICLIDSDKVEYKNLNRCPFNSSDVKKLKVDALRDHLISINSDILVDSMALKFKTSSHIEEYSDKIEIEKAQNIRDIVCTSDIVVIAFDDFEVRKDCYKLCNDNNINYLAIGLEIGQDESAYTCIWNYDYNKINTPKYEGYGEDNGSYASIVMEACAVGFNLLLNRLDSNNKSPEFISRKYYKFVEMIPQKP